MNLHKLLCARAAAGKPLRVGLIGAGKFGTMFLAQALRTPGLHLLGVADLAPARARENLARVGWPAERIAAASLGEAVDRGTTWIGDDAKALIAHPALDVVIDATGHPSAGIAHEGWVSELLRSVDAPEAEKLIAQLGAIGSRLDRLKAAEE